MKRLKTLVTIIIGLSPLSSTMAGENVVVLGGGVSLMSAYEGSNKYLFSPLIDLNYGYISDDYGVFSLGLEGAEWAIGITENLTFSS